MTSPRDDERVDAPLLLQPVVARPEGWRGRSGSLIAIGLAGFLVVALVLGTALDDGRPSSSAPIAVASLPSKPPTPRPTARPTTRPEPLATPLPVREVLGGQIPTERRLVYANGAEILDLGSGELTHFPSGIEYPLVPLPNGEVVCPCVIRDFAANGGTGSSLLRFGRYDQAGRAIVERDLRSFDDVVEVPDMTYGYDVAVALDPDAGSIDVLVIERHPPQLDDRALPCRRRHREGAGARGHRPGPGRSRKAGTVGDIGDAIGRVRGPQRRLPLGRFSRRGTRRRAGVRVGRPVRGPK